MIQGRNQDFNLVKQKYKSLTGLKDHCLEILLINHKRLFYSGTAKKLSRFGYFNTKSGNFTILIEPIGGPCSNLNRIAVGVV